VQLAAVQQFPLHLFSGLQSEGGHQLVNDNYFFHWRQLLFANSSGLILHLIPHYLVSGRELPLEALSLGNCDDLFE
jgi:hypothetical protein